YPRDSTACLIDQPWRAFSEAAMRPRDGAAAMAEMDRLWQGVPSGTQPRCRSPFGVYDLTGNVDEWTRTSREGERPSILKGGYWGPVRTRCRPTTRSHDENHIFYQQGFRCCTDAGAELRRRPHTDNPPGAPRPWGAQVSPPGGVASLLTEWPPPPAVKDTDPPAAPAPRPARWLDRLTGALLAVAVGAVTAAATPALLMASGVEVPVAA